MIYRWLFPTEWSAALQMDEVMAGDSWLAELFERHLAEIERRGLHVHREVEEGFRLVRDANLDRALWELFYLVFATVPDGCEVYLAAGRGRTPVAQLGVGQVTIRWQVAGRARPDSAGEPDRVVAIHPIAALAETLVDGAGAMSARAAFERAGWVFQLDAAPNGCELIARAHRG
ncbi:MAG: hypothetical protein GY910_02295 [bacterium]|nr:hypothetical protein [Deltaproteobacteria bacterium]MCP4903784.1 hypothetical protein [bacterium]